MCSHSVIASALAGVEDGFSPPRGCPLAALRRGLVRRHRVHRFPQRVGCAEPPPTVFATYSKTNPT
jgi:hypothetical protein